MYLHQKTSDAAYTVVGRNPSVDTSLEELTNYGTTLDWTSILSTAAAMDVTSSSAADTSAGTGAQKIRIYGINGSYAQTYEEITMNGQTTVTGTVTFLRVWGVEVVQSGSGKTNAGDIYVVKTGTGGVITAGVPATLTSGTAKVLAGFGSTMNGIFTTPAGQSWMIDKLQVSARGQACTFVIQVQDFAGDNSLKTIYNVEISGTEEMSPTIVIPEKTDVRIRVLAAGAGGIASATMLMRRV